MDSGQKSVLTNRQKTQISEFEQKLEDILAEKTEAFLANIQSKEDAHNQQITMMQQQHRQELQTLIGELKKQFDQEKTQLEEAQQAALNQYKEQLNEEINNVFINLERYPAYTMVRDWQNYIKGQKQAWEEFLAKSKENYAKEIEINKQQYNKINEENKQMMAQFQSDLHAITDNKINEIDSAYQQFKENLKNTEGDFDRTLGKLAQKIDKISEDAKKAMDGALQIGLAKAFMDKRIELNKSHMLWTVISLAALVGFVAYVTFIFGGFSGTLRIDNLESILSRIVLITPAIWLVWFSIKQYTKISELQAKYGFKEATSKAFTGYKQAAEDMDKNFAEMFLHETIKIISEDPVESFHRKKHETMPVDEVLKLLDKGLLKKDPHLQLQWLELAKLVVNLLEKESSIQSTDKAKLKSKEEVGEEPDE